MHASSLLYTHTHTHTHTHTRAGEIANKSITNRVKRHKAQTQTRDADVGRARRSAGGKETCCDVVKSVAWLKI